MNKYKIFTYLIKITYHSLTVLYYGLSQKFLGYFIPESKLSLPLGKSFLEKR